MSQTMDTAPKNGPLDDYGPTIVLVVDGRDVEGRWCAGLEMNDIWIPPGWYSDEGIKVEPAAWRAK